MLDVVDITKRYRDASILKGVTFHLRRGEKALLLGRNGVGKTTLLRIIACLDAPDSGTVTVAGYEDGRPSHLAARCLGYVGHASLLYQDLSVEENLRFYAGTYGLSPAEADQRVGLRIEELGLVALRRQRVRQLSQGQTKRLSIARALLHEPPLLLLDEPFATLDEEGRAWLVQCLRAERYRTVLLATHQLDFSSRDADRVLTLVDGRIVEGPDAGRPVSLGH